MNYESLSEPQEDRQPLFTGMEQEYWSRIRELPMLSEVQTRLLARQVHISEAAKKELDQRDDTQEDYLEEDKDKLIEKASYGQAARNRLCEHNLRIVTDLALRFYPSMTSEFDEASDIIQEGNIKLLKSISRYDPDKGSLYSYAHDGIQQGFINSLADTNPAMRVPTNKAWQYRRFQNFIDYLSEDLGREPTTAELANETNVDTEEIEIFQRYRNFVSFEGEYPELLMNEAEQTYTEDDVPEPEQLSALEEYIIDYEEADVQDTLVSALELEEYIASELDEREEGIIRRRYGYYSEPQILDEIGRYFRITRERVRQIEKEALRKLRAALEDTSNTVSTTKPNGSVNASDE